MTQKERLREIRKRHEEEQKRLKIKRNRIILATAVVVVLLLVIWIIFSCVNAVSNIINTHKAEKERIAAEEAARAREEQVLKETQAKRANGIDDDYYKDSAFIGNSFVEDLSLCGFLEETDFFYKTGLSVDAAMTDTMPGSGNVVVDELDNGKEYNKIFMMFGENELGWPSSDTFATSYKKLIKKVKGYQPNAQIYLLSITPITKKESDKNIDNTNNEQIQLYNDIIQGIAEDEEVVYADITKAVVGEDGNLPADAATDGVHFNKDYHKKCLMYIQQNY